MVAFALLFAFHFICFSFSFCSFALIIYIKMDVVTVTVTNEGKRKRDRQEEQHNRYELLQKGKIFNKRLKANFALGCSEAFLKTHWKHLKTQLIPETMVVYGDVYTKMNDLHTLFSEYLRFIFDKLPAPKQFRSEASWATFTPPFNQEMEDEYNKSRDLCEIKCKELTQEDRDQYFKTSPVFFINLQKDQIQSLISCCSWLQNVCRILSNKCLIQVAVMSDFVDKVSSHREKYNHRDLLLSSSLSANFIVFLDDDATGRDGSVLSTHTNCIKQEISVLHARSSVLYVSGALYHSSSTSRAYGIHHAERNPSKGSAGYVHTQRRFLLINCCPYSKLNMLDHLLNCESYTENSRYSLSECVFIYENNTGTVSCLNETEVTSCHKTLTMVKKKYKK
jgi:hypothetical protein